MPTNLLNILSPSNIILFVVVFTRFSGLMSSVPLISKYPIPIQIKVWFMAVVTFVVFPIVMAKSGFHAPTSVPELTLILLKEFIIGYIIGFIANVVFIGVEIAADLVSMQMGLTAAQAMDPTTGDTSPVFGQAYTILASFVFIGMNAFHWVFMGMCKSFQVVPPGYQVVITGNLTQNVIYLTSQMFVIGLSVALPIFSVLLITDFLLGFVAKMMPKMNIFMVALPVKIYLGLLLFIMLLQPMYDQMQALFAKYLSEIAVILGG